MPRGIRKVPAREPLKAPAPVAPQPQKEDFPDADTVRSYWELIEMQQAQQQG